MATEKWVTVQTVWCDLLRRNVAVMERRVYPADTIPDLVGYQVTARKCSAAIECNLAGYPCLQAFTNPFVDRSV